MKFKKSFIIFIIYIIYSSNCFSISVNDQIVPGSTIGDWKHGSFPSWGDRTHVGIDLLAPCGKDIFPFSKGTVVDIIDSKKDRNYSTLGYMVLIEHTNYKTKPFYTIYLHMQDPPLVNIGKEVNLSTKLGEIGITGSANNVCHTHFEIRYFQSRFSEWGNIYGNGDKHTDPYFIDNWIDPLTADVVRGSEFDVPICAEVVIDKSGSMNGNKFKKASVAVDSFIDRCEQSDFLGVAAFGNDASTVQTLIDMQSNPNRLLTKGNLRNVKCGGGTNIGAGLRLGYEDLKRCDGSMQKAIVLLSDGQNNVGDYKPILDKLTQENIPVYTILYGTKSGQDTLQLISSQTGGYYGNSETTDITFVYQKIAGMTKGESGLTSYNDTIEQNQTLAYMTDVPQDFRSLTISSSYQGSHIDLILKTPSGSLINSKNYDQFKGIKYIEAKTYSFYTIENPEKGLWKIELFGSDIPKKEQVNTLITGASPLMLNSFSSTSFYRKKQAVPITVQASEIFSGKRAKPKKVALRAIVRKPSPSLFRNTKRTKQDYDRTVQGIVSGKIKGEDVGVRLGDLFKKAILSSNKNEGLNIEGTVKHALFGATTIMLYDDGMHQDGKAGDNIYGGIYDQADQDGPYAVEIQCTAETQSGDRIYRTISESFQVGNILKNEITLSDFLSLF